MTTGRINQVSDFVQKGWFVFSSWKTTKSQTRPPHQWPPGQECLK